MAKRLDNCTYNKVKLLQQLSSLLWFIEMHAKNDAVSAQHAACNDFLATLEADLEKHVAQLQQGFCP